MNRKWLIYSIFSGICVLIVFLTVYFVSIDNQKYTSASDLSPAKRLMLADSLAEAENFQEALSNYHYIAEQATNLDLKDTVDINAALTSALVEAQIYFNIYNDYGNELKALKKGEKIARKYGLSTTGLDFLFGTLYFTIANQNNVDEYFSKGTQYFIKVLQSTEENREDLKHYAATNLLLYSNYGNVKDLSGNALHQYFNSKFKEEGSREFRFNLSLDSLVNFINQGKYDQASIIVDRFRKDETLPKQRVLPGIYFLSGRIAADRGNLEEARDYILMSESLIDPENGKDMMLEVYENLESLYSRLNDKSKEKEYAEKSKNLRRDLTSFTQISSLKNAEIEEEVTEIKDNLDNQIQRSENFKKVLILIIVFFLIAILFIGVLLYFFRKLRDNNKMLYQRYTDLLRLREATHNSKNPSENPVLKENIAETEDTNGETEKSEWEQYSSEIEKIDEILESCPDIYSPDFNATALSSLTGINPHTLSAIISGYYNSTFRNLINSRRIRTVCERIENSAVYDNFTIDAIAEDVGIKSRTTFTAAFKMETGMTPGKYLQFAKQRKEKKQRV